MRVLLADDEPLALRRLTRMVAEVEGVELVGVAADGVTALAEASRLRPDLLMLDIEMPGMNGMDVAATLTGTNGPQVIFLTAFERYATQAFVIEATDYLLKPVSAERLRVAIARAARRHRERAVWDAHGDRAAQSGATLHVPSGLGGRDVPLADVIWIEAARDYVLIHTSSRSHMVRSTMAEMAQRLPVTIARVHRSSFANIDQVTRVSRSESGVYRLHMKDGPALSVGPSYVTQLSALLRQRSI